MRNKFSETRLTERTGDDASGWQGHPRLRKYYEEKQRNIPAQHVWKCKQSGTAEGKRRRSLGQPGEKERESSTLREKSRDRPGPASRSSCAPRRHRLPVLLQYAFPFFLL